jgi:hypothetical protein
MSFGTIVWKLVPLFLLLCYTSLQLDAIHFMNICVHVAMKFGNSTYITYPSLFFGWFLRRRYVARRLRWICCVYWVIIGNNLLGMLLNINQFRRFFSVMIKAEPLFLFVSAQNFMIASIIIVVEHSRFADITRPLMDSYFLLVSWNHPWDTYSIVTGTRIGWGEHYPCHLPIPHCDGWSWVGGCFRNEIIFGGNSASFVTCDYENLGILEDRFNNNLNNKGHRMRHPRRDLTVFIWPS